MLLNVHIKNLALIDDISVDFSDKLNIITGETGAGKSIVIGALKIGMGAKLPKDLPRNPDIEGLCQLVFYIEDKAVWDALSDIGICGNDENELIITRRILNGRTINTINDEIVTAAKLKEASVLLVDMHEQHEQQTLLKKAEHLKILDKFGKRIIEPIKNELKEKYNIYSRLIMEKEALSMDSGERLRKLEFIKYEINEIESAKLKIGEDIELEKLYNRMNNSKDIIEASSQVYDATGYTKGSSAGNEISRALICLKNIKHLDDEISDIYSQLESIDALLNDFNVGLKDYIQSMEFDDSLFIETEDRLDTINKLKGKYGKTVEEINIYLDEIKAEYERLAEYDYYIEELDKKLSTAYKDMMSVAKLLSKTRKEQAAILCDNIRNALEELSFMQVKFDMVFDTLDDCTSNGIDDCYFVISTNVGEDLRPLYDVASGGELSRIMLAIKSCMANEDNIDTLIFDEIDVGISGRAAQKVAEKLAVIAKSHQVITITHLPQIAAMADNHYVIEKNVASNKTVTSIERLNNDGAIMELARLLGGAEITDNSVLAAKEMKDMAEKTKIHHN